MGSLTDLMAKIGAEGHISVGQFFLQLLVAAALSAALAFFYVRFGRSLANRRAFAANFVPITLTTMFVITVVKSSLAMSLGLVGALSIVRFRAAIREPEELIYLFICIALGLGIGANQWAMTLVMFAVLLGMTLLLARFRDVRAGRGQGFFLMVQGPSGQPFGLGELEQEVSKHARRASVRRYDVGESRVEATFDVEVDGLDGAAKLVAAIRQLNAVARCLLIDQQGRAVE